jgi:hypothetical protein
VLLLVGLYVVACGLYALLSLRVPRPVLFPDEFRYAHLARSLADGQGFDWRGEHIRQSAALYVYFITPAWALLHSTVDAWHASKVLGTLALCATVFPVWLLGRELIGPRLALVPAALSVAGTWMIVSAELVTETLAFPLTAAALCLTVMALRRPDRRLAVLAVLFLGLAIWARIQVAVLIPALFAAFVIDTLRIPEQRSARLRARQVPLIAVAVVSVLVTVIAFAAPSLTGDYAGFIHIRPSLGPMLRKSAVQLLQLVAAGGFVPLALAVAATASPRAWRDDRAGPLLAVFWPAAMALAVESGWFLTTYPTVAAIERYVVYVLPLALLVTFVIAVTPGLLSRWALGVGAAAMLVLLARPAVGEMGEERANWATSFRVHQVLGLSIGPALALVGLLLVAAVAVVFVRVAAPGRRALVLGGVLLAVFVVQDQAAWHQTTRTASTFRATLPADLEWVDHHSSGPVALLGITANAPQFDDLDFFNRSITQSYRPASGLPGRAVQGTSCALRIDQAGNLVLDRGCGPPAHRFLVNDPSARITFYGETASATDPKIGRVVEVKAGATPRVQSLVVLPCPRPSPIYFKDKPDIVPAGAPMECRSSVAGNVWVDAPAQVEVRYRGGSQPQTVIVGTRRWALPAGRETRIRFDVPRGYSQFLLQHDWTSSGGTPQVLSTDLLRGGRRTPLI